jgi:hypothetical protein
MGQMNQVTGFSTKLLITMPIFTTPLVMSGMGIDDMIAIDAVENGVFEKTTDGQSVGYVKPVKVTGTLMLNPGSTALGGIWQIQQAQALSGALIPGTLSVSNAVVGFSDAFTNFCITSAWTGHSVKDKVQDIPIKFSAEIPNSTLTQLINLGLSIASLVGG